jgi:electron transport complex protein RnfD
MKHNNYNAMLRPYWYATPSFRVIIIGTLLVLVPQVIMLFVTKSYASLVIICSAIAASLLAEALNKALRGTAGFDALFACLQGLLTGMFFPAAFPPLSVFTLTLFTLLLTKYAFGGVASSWINQAALTVALAYFVGAEWFPEFLVTKPQLVSENPVTLLFENRPLLPFDSRITGFLNSTILSATKTVIPPGLISFFWDSGAAIPVSRFNVLTIAASIVLILLDIIDWVMPACFLGVYFLLVWLFAPLVAGGGIAGGDILLASLTGGTLFTAFFMLGAVGTVPWSFRGKILYSSVAGCFAFIFLGGGTSPAGAVFTVLAANLLSAFIQFYEQQARRKLFRTKLMPLAVDLRRLSHAGK